MAKQLRTQVISDRSMDQARTCVDSQREEVHLAFELEWTRDTTAVRLRDWNNACISHRFGVRTTKWTNIRDYEEEVGYTYENLLSAVLLHYSQTYGDAAWVIPTNAAMTQVQRPKLGGKRIYLGPPYGRNHPHGIGTRICRSGPFKE